MINPTYIPLFKADDGRYFQETCEGHALHEIADDIFDGQITDVCAVLRVEVGGETKDVISDVVAMVQKRQHLDFDRTGRFAEYLADWIDANGGQARRPPEACEDAAEMDWKSRRIDAAFEGSR